MDSETFLVFCAIITALLILGALPMGLYAKQVRRSRELEHTERMKALELGVTLPGRTKDHPYPIAAKIALATGAGVPVGVFGFAWLASEHVGYHDGMWIAAAAVGTSAVFCGIGLAHSWLRLGQGSPEVTSAKPHVAEDAFDVVGARSGHA